VKLRRHSRDDVIAEQIRNVVMAAGLFGLPKTANAVYEALAVLRREREEQRRAKK
jgi:hypothetical protein